MDFLLRQEAVVIEVKMTRQGLNLISGLLKMLGCSVSHRFPDCSEWRQFEPEVILLAVGWYLRFSLSYPCRGGVSRRARPARRSRHGVAMGTALRPGNGTTFALEAQTDQ